MQKRLLTAFLALFIGVAITAALDLWRASYIEHVAIEHFEREARQRVAASSVAIERATGGMDALQVLFAGDTPPALGTFDQLATNLNRTPGVAASLAAKRVAGGARADAEAYWRGLYPEFSIRFRNSLGQLVRSPSRREYLPIVFATNSTTSPFLLGLDIGADRTLGTLIATLPPREIRLSRPYRDAGGKLGVLMVSWHGTGETEYLLGLALSPANIGMSLPNNEAIRDIWFDVSDPNRAEAIYPAEFDQAISPMRLLAVTDLNLGGRHWRLEARLTEQALATVSGLGQLQTWVLGLLLSILSSIVVWRFDKDRGLATQALLNDVNARLSRERDAADAEATLARRDGLRLQTILDTTNEAIVLLDDGGHIERFNKAAERLFAYSVDEVAGAHVGLLLPAIQRERQSEFIQQHLRASQTRGTNQELLAKTKDNVVFPVELSLNEFTLGDAHYFVGVIRDVSERKRAERMLFESEYKHRAILDAAHIGIYVLQDDQLRYVNPAFAAYFGRTPSDIIERRSLYDLIASAWREALAVAIDPERSSGRPTEVLMERPDGTRFYALITAKPILFDNRPGLAGSLLDISARKAAEEAMLRAEIRNAAILEAIPDLMLQLNADGIVVDFRGRNGGGDFGFSRDLIGQHYRFLPGEFASKLDDVLGSAWPVGVHTFEYSLPFVRGERYFEARLTPASEGESLVMVRDISGRKQIEGELIQHRDHLAEMVRERTAELNTLFTASPLPTALFAQDKFVEVNPAFEGLFGYPREWLVGESISKLLDEPGSMSKLSQAILTQLAKGIVLRMELRYRSADGRQILCEVFGKAVNPADPLGASIWIYQDIRERRAAEQALHDSKELAETANRAKSEFLANMSHELRTPMHAVLSFAELGERRAGVAAPEKLVHYFGRIRQSGQRLLQILNDLLDLSKLEAGKMNYDMQAISIVPILREVADEFLPLARTRSNTIDVLVPDAIPLIYGDALRLGQVVRNLVSNAIKFSPEHGKVVLRVVIQPSYLAVQVDDDGVGIPPDELALIFDKFIQSSGTKTGAGGTGLGLAITREIMLAHQGTISAENRDGGGARFTFSLPCVADGAVQPV